MVLLTDTRGHSRTRIAANPGIPISLERWRMHSTNCAMICGVGHDGEGKSLVFYKARFGTMFACVMLGFSLLGLWV